VPEDLRVQEKVVVGPLIYWKNVFITKARGLAAATVSRLVLPDMYAVIKRRLIGFETFVVVYHRISPEKDSWSFETLSPQSFERQIERFRQNHEILSLDRLVQCLRGEKPLPKRGVVITFDDGYKDNYLYAYPILRRLRVPATVFLVTGHISTNKMFWWDKVGYLVQHTTAKRLKLDELGSYSLEAGLDRSYVRLMIINKLKNLPEQRKEFLVDRLADISRVEIPEDLGKELILSWEEVREMSRNGIDLGAHSVTHPIMTHMSLSQARWEIKQSRESIDEKVGKEVSLFAYPDGDFTAEIAKLAKECGFAAAVTIDNKWITPKTDCYQLSRIYMSEDSNTSNIMLCGLWGDLQAALGQRKGYQEHTRILLS